MSANNCLGAVAANFANEYVNKAMAGHREVPNSRRRLTLNLFREIELEMPG